MSSNSTSDHREITKDEALGAALVSLVLGFVIGIVVAGFLQTIRIPSPPPSNSGSTYVQILAPTKDALAALQSAATIFALGAGAYWFYRRRARFPRLVWSQDITHQKLSESVTWVNVQVRVENKGEVHVKIPDATTRIYRVIPVSEADLEALLAGDPSLFHQGEILWPKIGECLASPGVLDLEPSEATTFERDFLIPADVQLIVVYTFVPNQERSKTGHGWPIQSICSLNDPPSSRKKRS